MCSKLRLRYFECMLRLLDLVFEDALIDLLHLTSIVVVVVVATWAAGLDVIVLDR